MKSLFAKIEVHFLRFFNRDLLLNYVAVAPE